MAVDRPKNLHMKYSSLNADFNRLKTKSHEKNDFD